MQVEVSSMLVKLPVITSKLSSMPLSCLYKDFNGMLLLTVRRVRALYERLYVKFEIKAKEQVNCLLVH